ncbi:hypothetical protein MMC16_005557 [Acarospora aff. strigata]|nr:hypothetical protein [Acarospora aff. strigata]
MEFPLPPSNDIVLGPTEFSDILNGQIDNQGSYSFSKTWVSQEMKERDKFFDIVKNLERMNLVRRSPFLPTTLAGWYVHQLDSKEAEIKELQRKIALRIAAGVAKKHITDPSGTVVQPAFGGKTFGDNRTAVLAFESIWCPWSTGTAEKPEAPWPTRDEMEFEGDERVTSGFSRFPPLPRVVGNETVTWKCKANILGYAFDQVWTLPTAQNSEAVPDDEEMVVLVESDLLVE